MRKIKFRAWSVGKNRMFSCEQMVEDQLTLLPDGRFINVSGDDTSLSIIFDRDRMIPMMFTGLIDKNGKEIYEGDIVKWRSIHNKRVTDGHIDAVEFTSGYWNLTPWIHELYSTHDDIEVIGNIYENPIDEKA